MSLIVFEGIDNSGKTTISSLLYAELTTFFHLDNVIITKDPGGTNISSNLRNILLESTDEKLTNQSELLLFMASRSQLIENVINPALKAGKIIICDRFNDSTYAYQGYGRGIDFEMISKLEIFIKTPTPDIVFIFNTKINADRTDRIERESEEFANKVCLGYVSRASRIVNKPVYYFVDTTKPINEIISYVMDKIILSLKLPLYSVRAIE
jgi:dTMP kinase